MATMQFVKDLYSYKYLFCTHVLLRNIIKSVIFKLQLLLFRVKFADSRPFKLAIIS